ncbi:MAG: AbrB/MazE/SpoVT family DNA-binding domain-containing protein [Ectothiorhodospiraceae bacterium]|nr:AbrB/MazE/SpoVT family DNA-binding domain-containing protein [Ectothiorhodospiraceae bacterium]MBN4053032.1 AbrB/MazE/SpoVT family DNA-binding domain-containing protein [Gammaproteobacteria bacterium AH-315-K14]
MASATLSSKYQLAIPKAIREELGLQAGQKFTVLAKGNIVELIPQRSLAESRGLFKGADPTGYRDRKDRV